MRYNGRDREVIDYLAEDPSVEAFLISVFVIVDIAAESYMERDFTDLTVNFGCTGGQHRSVFCAEKLAARLKEKGIAVRLRHRELGISE
jgi:RNase adaptor protein for sRNA GlmZ degradation